MDLPYYIVVEVGENQYKIAITSYRHQSDIQMYMCLAETYWIHKDPTTGMYKERKNNYRTFEAAEKGIKEMELYRIECNRKEEEREIHEDETVVDN